MRTPEISTGTIVTDSTRIDANLLPTPGGIDGILFSPDQARSDDPISQKLILLSGEVAFVSAYNMPPSLRIFTNLNIHSSYALPTGGGCGEPGISLRGSVVEHTMRMGLGDPRLWEFQDVYTYNPTGDQSRHRTQMLISTPGVYTFEVEDISMLSTLFMCYSKWKASANPYQPFAYYGGIPVRM